MNTKDAKKRRGEGPRFRRTLALAVAGFWLVWTGASRGDDTLAFADDLFRHGDYYRAITEYERFLFLNAADASAPYARLRVALSYFKGQQWEPAAEGFRRVWEAYGTNRIGQAGALMLAETFTRQDQPRRAADTLGGFLQTCPAGDLADAARVKLGAALLRGGDVAAARAALEAVPTNAAARSSADGILGQLARYPDLPGKSPALAGAMSAVLPGAGQLYVGRPSDAALSFVLNGFLIWAAVEAFDNDENVTGSLLTVIEAGWYLGNVYNAVNGAHKYNRRARDGFFDDLQVRYGVSVTPDARGVLGGLELRF